MPKAVNDGNFEAEVLKSPVPVAVDFWAEWCMPCRMLAPVLEQVASEMGEKVKIAKLNVDESPATAGKYGIMSIPTILVFKNGAVVDRFVGVRPKLEIVSRLSDLSAGPAG
ncbi:MAG: thioredoxin [Armatimonadota bacterium]